MPDKLKLGSLEWVQEFAKRCNKNEYYLKFAQGLNTAFNLSVPDAEIAFNWKVVDGKAQNLKEGLSDNAEFSLEGQKEIWLQIISGKI